LSIPSTPRARASSSGGGDDVRARLRGVVGAFAFWCFATAVGLVVIDQIDALFGDVFRAAGL
jgi:hypothetical protein